MSGTGGTALDRKQILVSEGQVASVIATLADGLGYHVVPGGKAGSRSRPGDARIDLRVVETTHPDGLESASAPVVAVAPRRLRHGEAQRLRAAGAARVLDTQACLLEAAFGLADLLFDSCHDQRRYAETHGRIPVRFEDATQQAQHGCLTGLTRRGGFVDAEVAPPEGAPLTLLADIGPWTVPIPARVAYVEDARRQGFCVELALEHDPLAPRLERFLTDSSLPQRAPRRSASGVSA